MTVIAPAALPVLFRDTTLTLIDRDGEPFAALRPIAEGMGLDWKSQHVKIVGSRFKSTVVEITTVAEDGKQRAMTCLPLRKLAGWLMSIHPSKVAPEIRARIVAFQNECDDALWAHWSGRSAPALPAARPAPLPAVMHDPAYRLQARRELLAWYERCANELKKAGVQAPGWFRGNDEIADGLVADMLAHQRWLLAFDDELRPRLTPVARDACLVNPDSDTGLRTLVREYIPNHKIPVLMNLLAERLAVGYGMRR